MDPLAEIFYSISPYVYVKDNPLKYIDPTGMASRSSNPSQWKDLYDHLPSGKSLSSFGTSGWEEVEDPKEEEQDFPPIFPEMTAHNWYMAAAEQETTEKIKNTGQKYKSYLIASNPSLLGIITSTHAISVKYSFTGSGGASGAGSGEGILILSGPYAGTLLITGNGNAGVGTIHVSVNYNLTSYTYTGDISNLKPSTFEGHSTQMSVGGDFIGHFGLGASLAQDSYGGILFGRTLSVGLGFSATAISIYAGLESSKIIYIKDLIR